MRCRQILYKVDFTLQDLANGPQAAIEDLELTLRDKAIEFNGILLETKSRRAYVWLDTKQPGRINTA